jgi:phosphoribosylformimino-5-aminoimidazole carboxamide ribotide isomerase
MIIYPAMDLMGGKIVRLRQGRFDDATVYSDEPLAALQDFASSGATWTHVVDLDGARAREPRQHQLIASLGRSADLKLQAGGGFRTRDQIASALDHGIARVVLGSIAVNAPDRVSGWIEEFRADRICLAIDVRVSDQVPFVVTGGWVEESGSTLWDVARRIPNARHLLVTDVGRDGMLTGPNFDLYREIGARLPDRQIQASGGVSSLADLANVETAGVIIGKAIWEGSFDLKEALRLACA